jgi:hypothetical protein
MSLCSRPGLTTVEMRAVHSWFIKWREHFDGSAKTSPRRVQHKVKALKG